jgi:succinoglycan biosynthesis protein ExoM
MFAVDEMTSHISVCICTYKRPEFLKRLLKELGDQETAGKFTYSIVVADNDATRSAEPLVAQTAVGSPIPITYCVEPRQNISLARNKAIENATGTFVAFIDDDEFPDKRWLLTLFEACIMFGVDGVLGPVQCHFDEVPPSWVVRGKFYERPTYPTGLVIDWPKGRTGNVLFKRELFTGQEMPFSPDFHRAGDQDFFRRMIAKGHVFVWCNEAAAFEVVPPVRWTRTFMLKRALLRGTIGMQHPATRVRRITKAIIAVPLYTVALPFALLLGQHIFMNILIRLFDHFAALLTAVGLKPVTNQLVTD